MRDVVVKEAPAGPIRVLDLGCGTGSLVERLASALPDVILVGIDVSPANIDAARRSAPNPRVRFEVVDYLQFSMEPFDVIVSDGVLHLVRGDTDALVAKLARDVRPGGILVCDMPYACAYNTVFAFVRRLLRSIRTPQLDRAILLVGRLFHGRDMNVEALQERVAYMYIPPERVMDARLLDAFSAAGFRRRADHDAQHTSLSQLRHRVTVFVRDASRR